MTVTEPDRFSSLVSKLRVVLWLYFSFLVLGSLLLYIFIGAGARHGGEVSFGRVLSIVVPCFMVMALPPLAFLSKSRSGVIRAVQALGILQLLLVFAALLYWIFHGMLQPKIWEAKLALRSRSIVLENVTETAYIRPDLGSGATQLGLDVVFSVRIPKDIVLDRYGNTVLEALERGTQLMAISRAKGPGTSFESLGKHTVLLNDLPLRELPALAHYIYRESNTPIEAVLPAGLYQIRQTYLFPGLSRGAEVSKTLSGRSEGDSTTPLVPICKNDRSQTDRLSVESDKQATVAVFAGTMSFSGRNAHIGFSRKADLQYRYDAVRWKATLDNTSLASCSDLQQESEREHYKQLSEERSRNEMRNYLDGSINPVESTLYAEACAGDETALRQRMENEKLSDGSWMPMMPLKTLIADCTLKRPNIAIFTLLAPAFYQQGKSELRYSSAQLNQNAVCDVLSDLHSYRRLDFLEALIALKLPIDCEGKQLWRHGIVPNIVGEPPIKENSDYRSKFYEAALNRHDHAQWITLLASQKIDLCQPISVTISDRKRHSPLLNIVIPHFPPELILAILKTGCDPQMISQSERSPALSWNLRRHSRKNDYQYKEVLSNNKRLVAEIDQRMRISGTELNELNGRGGTSVFLELTPRILESPPQLLRILLKAGAKPNAGLKTGETWFKPFLGSNISGESDKLELAIALLNVLSDTELRQVLNQGVKHIDQVNPGLYALQKPRDPKHFPAPLRDYICKRRVLDCR